MYSVAVIGGGPAGLSCALTLADGARRFDFAKGKKFLVVDSGSSDVLKAVLNNVPGVKRGTTGEEYLDFLRAQVEEFEDVNIVDGEVCEVYGEKGNFTVVLSDGREFKSELIVFSTGFHSFNIKTDLVEVIPHPRSPRPGKVALKPKVEGIFVAGLSAGEITMVATASGSGVDVACRILSDWAGKVVVGHDSIK
ncbi:MAG: NAD(P)/FAD-dependent oxidoreductase [Thermovibrio sp.]|nr:MAG: NAD(P)/FAD-dependent oxidoreductase [Thermovibrio sp.]